MRRCVDNVHSKQEELSKDKTKTIIFTVYEKSCKKSENIYIENHFCYNSL